MTIPTSGRAVAVLPFPPEPHVQGLFLPRPASSLA